MTSFKYYVKPAQILALQYKHLNFAH